MFKSKKVSLMDKEPVKDILGAVDDCFGDLIEYQKAARDLRNAEIKQIDAYQDLFFAIVENDKFEKDKAYDLINKLLKLCREINQRAREELDHVLNETGSGYAVVNTVMELLCEEIKE